MHAIFSISAAPLLMLRGSSERKNDLQKDGRNNLLKQSSSNATPAGAI